MGNRCSFAYKYPRCGVRSKTNFHLEIEIFQMFTLSPHPLPHGNRCQLGGGWNRWDKSISVSHTHLDRGSAVKHER